jgi:hypothetical protein
MSAVQIDTVDGRTTLRTPFNRNLTAQARLIGGRWDATAKVWRFDARDEERVRDLALDLFGTDGTEDPTDLVTVRVAVRPDPGREGEARCTVAGRIIAERPGRDEAVRLAPVVVLVAGSFAPYAGSIKYPELGAVDAVLEIRDLPRAAAIAVGLTIVEPDGQTPRAALVAERDRLLARLVAIEEELG